MKEEKSEWDKRQGGMGREEERGGGRREREGKRRIGGGREHFPC